MVHIDTTTLTATIGFLCRPRLAVSGPDWRWTSGVDIEAARKPIRERTEVEVNTSSFTTARQQSQAAASVVRENKYNAVDNSFQLV